MGDTPTCEYREWLPDDEGQPTGPVCGRPARWFSCAEYIDQPVCDEHRCRCRKPIATNRTDGRLTMGDIAKRLREEAERRGRLMAMDHGGEAASAFGLHVAADLVDKWEAERADDAELAKLREENERLRAALTEMVRTHAGSHSEDCHACGAHDDDVSDDPDTPDPHCDCGALATRQAARAALRGGT